MHCSAETLSLPPAEVEHAHSHTHTYTHSSPHLHSFINNYKEAFLPLYYRQADGLLEFCIQSGIICESLKALTLMKNFTNHII